ncbi:MAG: NAD(P)H-dependent oxidoreductase subunit E, partial [Acidobacteria bacterium]
MNLTALEPQALEIIKRYDEPRAAMLPLLWLVQTNVGHIPSEAECWVGGLLGVAVSHVREVVSFYSMFRTREAGRHELRVCTSLPCMLRGAGDVLAQIEERWHIRPGETTPDGELTLTEVECLC